MFLSLNWNLESEGFWILHSIWCNSATVSISLFVPKPFSSGRPGLHVPSPRNLTQECHPNMFTLLLFRSSANSYRVTDTWDCKVKVASKNQDQGKKKTTNKPTKAIKSNINTMFWSSLIIPFSLIKRWLRSYSIFFWPNPRILLLFTSLNSTHTKKNPNLIFNL